MNNMKQKTIAYNEKVFLKLTSQKMDSRQVEKRREVSIGYRSALVVEKQWKGLHKLVSVSGQSGCKSI